MLYLFLVNLDVNLQLLMLDVLIVSNMPVLKSIPPSNLFLRLKNYGWVQVMFNLLKLLELLHQCINFTRI